VTCDVWMISGLYMISSETCAADLTTRSAANLHVWWRLVDSMLTQPKCFCHPPLPRAVSSILVYLLRVPRRLNAPSKAPSLMIRADKVRSDIDVLVSNPAQALLGSRPSPSRNTCLQAAICLVTGWTNSPRRVRRRTKRLTATRKMIGGVGYPCTPFQHLS
jgi:hypothetical protein